MSTSMSIHTMRVFGCEKPVVEYRKKLANFIQHFSSQNSMVPEDLGSLSRSSSTDENTFSGSDAVSYQEHWKTSDDDSKSSEVFQSLPQSTPGKSQNFKLS